jgi:peptidoglycan/xylan/chitin deacetylase (PgdA/CDA1 family)
VSATRNSILAPRAFRIWLTGIITTACLLLAIAISLLYAPTLLKKNQSSSLLHPARPTHTHAPAPTPVLNIGQTDPVPPEYQQAAAITAQQYMTALLDHRYTTMWSLLHPRAQAMWPNESTFTTYWQNRFKDYILQKFVLGDVHWLHHWVNPETMTAYNQVFELPVSLLLAPDLAIQQHPLAPPEDARPRQLYQDLPFIVQKVAGTAKGTSVRWLVLNGGPADLEAPILPPLHPTYSMVQVPILMYHHISNIVPPTLLGISLTVTPTAFSKQLDYLKQQGYHTITFNQLFDALYYGGPLPRHPIILTFDDGYDDAYNFAFPILQAHGYSGMFYIITGKIGWAAYLNWKQIRALLAGGMQIGSHTVHHVDMGSLVLYSTALAQHELQASQATLQNHLGVAIQQFCYPSGEPFRHGSLAARRQIVTLLAADGYVGGTTDPGMSGIIQNSQTPLALLRIRVDGRSTLQFFIHTLPW